MEPEAVVCWMAALMTLAGWASLVGGRCSRSREIARLGDALLVASLVGLGTVTVIAASMQIGCALISGLNITGLLVAVILAVGNEAAPTYSPGRQAD